MTSQSFTEADEELLSAYLDQELSPTERIELEQRLVVEPPLRQHLAELRKACDLLENLPDPTLKPNFTQTTMEMVAINLEQEDVSRIATGSIVSGPIKNRWGWWTSRSFTTRWLTIGFLAVLLGSLVGWRLRAFSQKIELRSMAVGAYLPTLLTFPNLSMLKRLNEIPYWEDLLKDRSINDRMLPDPPYFEELSNVRKWVGSLDVQQQSVLWNQQKELTTKDFASTMADVNYYVAIQSQPNSQELLTSGSAFVALLNAMPSNRRDEILSLPPDRQIIRLRQDAYYAIALDHTDEFTTREKATIVNWGQNEFEARLRDAIPVMKEAPLERLLYFSLYILPQHSNMILDDHEELCELLCEGLSKKSRTLFQGLAHESQTLVMMAWLMRSAGFQESKPPTTDELLEFYRGIPNVKREEFDLTNPTQALERLKNDYRMDQNFQRREKRVEKAQNAKGLKDSPRKK